MEKSRQELIKAEKKLSGLPKGKMVYAAATHFKPGATSSRLTASPA